MRVHQPGSSPDAASAAPRSTTGRGRRRAAGSGSLWRLTQPYRWRTALSVVSLLTATATGARAALPREVRARRRASSGHGGSRLFVVVAIFVAAGLANWGMTYVETYLTGWVGERILADLRVRLFAHLQRLSLGFYERNRAGVIISRLTNDVEAIDQLVTDGVTSLVQNTLTLLGTAIILFVLDWRLALATCVVIPLMGVATAIFRTRSARAYAAVRERLGLVTATLAEDIAGMRDRAGVHARAAGVRATSATVARRYRDANMQTVVLNGIYFPFVDLLSSVALAVVLGVRRPSLLRRLDHARDALRVHALRPELLRPGAAALAALQHVPLGDRGARQDHGRARRGARGARPAGRARARRRSTATSRFEDVRFTLRPRRRGAARHRPRRAGRNDRRARRPHGRGQVDDREAARALLRADATAGSPSTAST